MFTYRNLTTVCCAAVLAFGLAACGGGDDDDTAEAPTTMEPTGPTQAELDAAAAAAAAAEAKAAEEEAARMAAEEALAAEQAKQLRATAMLLGDAINSGPVDGSTPPVEQSPLVKFKALTAVIGPPLNPAVPSLTGAGLRLGLEGATTDGADDGRTPLMATGESVGALGSWAGTMYGHKSADTGVSNDAVVYINRADTPGKPFAEGVGTSLLTLNGGALTASRRLVVWSGGTTDGTTGGASTATKNVAGDGFPTAGTTTYTADPVSQSVIVEGTYKGAPGSYSCVPTATNMCAAVGSSAGVNLNGAWQFVADAGAMTSTQDVNYLYFGWWLMKNVAGAPTNAGAFTGVVNPTTGAIEGVTAPPLSTNPGAATSTGSATYAGAAAGKFAIDDPLGDAGAGHFTADVSLKATFGNTVTSGVTGTVDNFTLNDEHEVDWSVRLRRAPWDGAPVGAYGNGATTGDGTVWTIDGEEANASSGSWRGQMYDEKPGGPPAGDNSDVPTSTTGTFHSQYGQTHSMVGAYGAARE